MAKEEYVPSHLREGFDESKIEVIPEAPTTVQTSTIGARSGDGGRMTGSAPKIATTGGYIAADRKNKRASRKHANKIRWKVREAEAKEQAQIDIVSEAEKFI